MNITFNKYKASIPKRKIISILLATIILIFAFTPTAYAGAKMQVVKNEVGKSSVDISLKFSDVLTVGDINVTASIGSGLGQTFPASFSMNRVVSEYLDSGGNHSGTYALDFSIPLLSSKMNGTYPIAITITDDNGNTDTFSLNVSITNGANPPTPTPTPKVESTSTRPRPEPKLIIQKYSVSKDPIMAGEEFEIDLTLLNTQDRYHTYNVLLTYTGESVEVLPSGDSNAIYIDEIEDEETHDVTLKMKARLDAEAKPYKININMTYENSGRTGYTVTESIVVEVSQPIRISHDDVSLTKTVNAGDSIPLSMQVINKGKSTLFNVQVSMEMNGAIPDASAYLGNMEQGTSEMAEIYVFFGTLDMNSDSKEKYGYTEGKMLLTYEDEYGKEYNEEIPLSTTIERPVFDDLYTKEEPEEEEKVKAGQWWVSIALLLAIGIAVFGFVSYRRKVEKLRREYGDNSI